MARRAFLVDMALAVVIVAVLTTGWAIADWPRLRALLLPDPDDMLRLVQIRDWIAGQAFDDLSQHRLGGGLAMHWSRLPDLVPAALILLIEAMVGRHAAEVATVILWPSMLLVAALLLLASCARRLSGERAAGRIAMLIGALAYPATAFFLPGRIDHHGLQLVLLLNAAHAMVATPSLLAGGIAGAAVAASIAIGLETAPLCAILLGVVALRWSIDAGKRTAILTGMGLGLGGAMTLAVTLLAPWIWPATLCDALTPPVAWLTLIAGGLLLAIGLAERMLDTVGKRVGSLAVAGLALACALPLIAPACLAGPYGALSPLLKTLWLRNVVEAQPLLAAAPGVVLGYGGLMLAGIMVGGVRIARGERGAPLLSWAALQAGALALSCVQLRMAPFGAALAVPVLAGMVLRARVSEKPLGIVAAWLAAAGIFYPLAGGALDRSEPVAASRPPCLTAAYLARIAAVRGGMIAVPLDMGPYVLGTSGQAVLAAPYHRNAAANLAHYRLFLGSPHMARAAARRWHIAAIAYCPAWLADLDPGRIAANGSIVAVRGRAELIEWADPVITGDDLVILRVKP